MDLSIIVLIIGVSLFFLGLLFYSIAIIAGSNIYEIISVILFLLSVVSLVGSAVISEIEKKRMPDEKRFTIVVKTNTVPVIDTTIVIKNGVADTTYVYKFF